MGDQVYLNMRGSDEVLVAKAEALRWIPTNQYQWRDLTVLNLEGTRFPEAPSPLDQLEF